MRSVRANTASTQSLQAATQASTESPVAPAQPEGPDLVWRFMNTYRVGFEEEVWESQANKIRHMRALTCVCAESPETLKRRCGISERISDTCGEWVAR